MHVSSGVGGGQMMQQTVAAVGPQPTAHTQRCTCRGLHSPAPQYAHGGVLHDLAQLHAYVGDRHSNAGDVIGGWCIHLQKSNEQSPRAQAHWPLEAHHKPKLTHKIHTCQPLAEIICSIVLP